MGDDVNKSEGDFIHWTVLSNLGLLSTSQSVAADSEGWVALLKVMLQNPQHEIANSIFNLIQRTGSQVLICTVSAWPGWEETGNQIFHI